jgi:hypothetical protein
LFKAWRLERNLESARKAVGENRMDYAAQSARRAEVLQKTIAKWKDSAPLALARFLDDLGLHQLLLEIFPAATRA